MSFHPHQQKALITLLVYVAIAAGIGALFNYTLLFVCITLFAYVIYQLKHLFQLHNWLLNRSQNPPDARGYWGELFNEIHLMEKDKRKHRSRLNKVLSRFQDAAQALPDGAIILTKYNDIEWANQSACTMMGINPEKDIGQKIFNLIRNPKFQQYLNKKDYSLSITMPRPMQPEHQLEIQVVPFGSNQKLILCRDVTHVAQLEAMRSRFISNVSHELRSPLTVIKGYMEMLQEDNEDISPHQVKVFKNMNEQVLRMDRLVEDLLTLTRLETEPVKPNEEVDVSSMLSAIRDNALVFGKDKNQTITLDIDTNLNLIGDNDELASLFTNLVNNAVRYTPENGEIAIKWHLERDNAIFSVTDTGPGIEQEHLARLTERFYRVDTARSRETGGTGLGLSIVKHILERHDGQLNIDSTPGKGSTFVCRFPTHRFICHT
ncbi:MAG: phosphate regulon sensor histidine kinase PhoR [Gammaproteobacteria bacterium]